MSDKEYVAEYPDVSRAERLVKLESEIAASKLALERQSLELASLKKNRKSLKLQSAKVDPEIIDTMHDEQYVLEPVDEQYLAGSLLIIRIGELSLALVHHQFSHPYSQFCPFPTFSVLVCTRDVYI